MSSPGIAVFEIPLQPAPQQLQVQLGGTTYTFLVLWRDGDQGGWFLDIYDSTFTNKIVCGISLVTGIDLLKQYGYLDFGGELFVRSDSNPPATPTFTNLGQTSHLYWLPFS